MNDFLRATQLGKTYRKGSQEVEVLKDLDFELSQGECVAIVGESGAGKTTLLQLLGALSRPSSGEVWFANTLLRALSEKELATFRNRSIGFIFQFHYLLPEFDSLENVTMPLRMRKGSLAVIRKKAQDLLEAVGLSHRVTHRPSELSGGEQQRVAIARALICDPQILLADEPTGNLDLETQRTVSNLLFDVVRSGNRSMIVATHNLELANAADRILKLEDGKLHPEAKHT